jgi:hypothetical protein
VTSGRATGVVTTLHEPRSGRDTEHSSLARDRRGAIFVICGCRHAGEGAPLFDPEAARPQSPASPWRKGWLFVAKRAGTPTLLPSAAAKAECLQTLPDETTEKSTWIPSGSVCCRLSQANTSAYIPPVGLDPPISFAGGLSRQTNAAGREAFDSSQPFCHCAIARPFTSLESQSNHASLFSQNNSICWFSDCRLCQGSTTR